MLERAGALETVCQRRGVSLAEAALRFPLAHPAVVSVLTGAQTADEVELNVAALEAIVPPALWRDLASSGLIRADAPVPAATGSC